jgi:hypothetical protein
VLCHQGLGGIPKVIGDLDLCRSAIKTLPDPARRRQPRSQEHRHRGPAGIPEVIGDLDLCRSAIKTLPEFPRVGGTAITVLP